MLDYNVMKSLKMSLSEARRQAKAIGMDDGIIVAEAKNIPGKDSTKPLDEMCTFEETICWGTRDEQKIKFVRDYTHDSHLKKMDNRAADGVGWGAAVIAFGRIDYYYDHEPYGYSIAFSVLADNSENGRNLLNIILSAIEDYKPVIIQ